MLVRSIKPDPSVWFGKRPAASPGLSGGSGGPHCRKCASSRKQLTVKVHTLSLRIANFPGIEHEVQYVVWIETEIGMLSALQTAHNR